MQTDIILYLITYKEDTAFKPRKDWIISKVFKTREEAENYCKGKPAISLHAELLENVEQKKQKALSKLSTVEKFLLFGE